MNARGWTLRRIAGIAMLAYGAAAAIASLRVLLTADMEGLAGLIAVLAFFTLVYAFAFLVLGFLVLRHWLGRAPLAGGAFLSGAAVLWLLSLPRLGFVNILTTLAVTVVAVVAMVKK